MPRRRRTLLHGLLLSADSGIRVSLGHLFSVVNTLLICLVFLVTAVGGVQGGSCACPVIFKSEGQSVKFVFGKKVPCFRIESCSVQVLFTHLAPIECH
jgi:hypothetical protein